MKHLTRIVMITHIEKWLEEIVTKVMKVLSFDRSKVKVIRHVAVVAVAVIAMEINMAETA